MTKQLTLNLREHDLPPEWDGTPITWEDEWGKGWEPFICPPPKEKSRCEDCGSATLRNIKLGRVGPRRVLRFGVGEQL